MKRYCIKRRDTGRYYWRGGVWAEEPQWFDAREARLELSTLPAVTRVFAVIESHEFSAMEVEE